MSARRVADTFSLPANPSYIDFPRTDGSPSTWPPNISRVVDNEGHVNFYSTVDSDHSQNKKWRSNVGDAISLKLKMPEGPSYVLRNFPDGYRLYDHHKGPADVPRHDLYLFGPVKKRFRSINEFIPHAIWLMGDPSATCECKYCAKKPQKEVTASISSILRTSTTPTRSPAPPKMKIAKEKGKARDPDSRIKEAKKRDTRIYAAIQRAVEPLKPSPHVLKQPMLVERSNDLRGVFSKASMHVPRWFREGEIVWCALNPPIYGTEGNLAIEYWPATVDEVLFKAMPVPRNSHPDDDRNSYSPPGTPQASTSTIRPNVAHESEKGPMLEPSTEPLPWKVQQTMRYKVQLLAVAHYTMFDNADVLPYQAYMPSVEVLHMLSSFPVEQFNFDKQLLSKFNPCPGDKTVSIHEAISPYTFALQMASSLSSYWCLTDDYELKCRIPPTASTSLPSSAPNAPPNPSTSRLPPPQSLHEAIEAASQHNVSHKHIESISTAHAGPGKSGQNPSYHSTGVPSPRDQLVQTRYQGLWWGAERIWVDDFIRLKIPRRALAPSGANHILPAAGPGQSCLKTVWLDSSLDVAELGAGNRGIFLRVDGVMAVDVPADNATGTKKEARICGVLYELADEDWVDPNELPATNGATTTARDSEHPPVAGTSSPQTALRTNVALPTKAANDNNRPNSGPPLGMKLPQAPQGYKFRPILDPGYEFVGALGLIGGRYYPRVLTHPRVIPTVQRALDEPSDIDGNNLWALEGLSGGYFNSIDPSRYKKNRRTMLEDADKEAITQLQTYLHQRSAEKGDVFGPEQVNQGHQAVKGMDSMDVDDIY